MGAMTTCRLKRLPAARKRSTWTSTITRSACVHSTRISKCSRYSSWRVVRKGSAGPSLDHEILRPPLAAASKLWAEIEAAVSDSSESIDSFAPVHFDLSVCLDHSHCPVLAPATLAALPSTRAIPNRDVFYIAHPIDSIETRSLPTLTHSYPRRFTLITRTAPCLRQVEPTCIP